MLPDHDILLRLMLAAVLGGVVGLERERLEWVAGLRTHMLVCVGSTLAMIVSAYGFNEVISADRIILDPSRVAAQVVSGIGFLGAGTILFLRQQVIRGLTTAASLWTVAMVGLAVGGGLYLAASAATGLIVVILALVKPLENRLFRRQKSARLVILVDRQRVSLQQLEAEVELGGVTVKQITLRRGDTPQDDFVEFALMSTASKASVLAVVARLQAVEGVRAVNI
jgi:putative Mg2+ transporter-C (MgtC) family protein